LNAVPDAEHLARRGDDGHAETVHGHFGEFGDVVGDAPLVEPGLKIGVYLFEDA